MTTIRATFTKFLDVPSRKIVQIVLEIPSEAADSALKALGGWPRPDESRWVAVVRLTEKAATQPVSEPEESKPDKPSRRMAELSRVQQAGIHCNDPLFCRFLVDHHLLLVAADETIKDAAIRWVRRQCRSQRRNFDNNREAGELWDVLRAEFDGWAGRTARPDERSAG